MSKTDSKMQGKIGEYLLNEHKLVISCDPGFDSNKIVINGEIYKYPYNVVDITGQEGTRLLFDKSEGYILSHYVEGKSYLVGEEARKRLMEVEASQRQDQKQPIANSFDKFETDDFMVSMMSCVGHALVSYSKLTGGKFDIEEYSKWYAKSDKRDRTRDLYYENANFTFYMSVALPHDTVDDTWKVVKKKTESRHVFDIEMCDGKHEIAFEVKYGNTSTSSQAKAAFMGLVIDDLGNAIKNPEIQSPNNVPCLLIDGGYKTVGIFKLSRDGSIVQAESNTTYAMYNINKAVEDELVEKYGITDVKEYQIEEIISEGGFINYEDSKGKSAKLDVKQIREQKKEEIFGNFWKYLNEKYNKLMDIHSFIMTGGTSQEYSELTASYIKEYREHIKMFRTDYDFNGKKLDPVYGVTVGMFKILLFYIQNFISEE